MSKSTDIPWKPKNLNAAARLICTGAIGKNLDEFDHSGYEEMERLSDFLDKDYTVLDFGGGVGRIAKHVAPLVKELILVDIAPSMLDIGKNVWCKDITNIRWVQNFKNLPLEDASIDFAYSLVVFFHLRLESNDAVFWLEEMSRVLKPNGYIIIGDLVKYNPVSDLEVVETRKKYPNIPKDGAILTIFRKREKQ